MHAATFVLDYLDGFELVTDIAPGVLGADLGDAATSTAAQAADEAMYVAGSLGDRLCGFEIGNEPDEYAKHGAEATTFAYADFASRAATATHCTHRLTKPGPLSKPLT